ncbi:MAG: hypothetical protein DSO02_05395 [Hadesarchaea archaeon]|nr:MAG: hypothetical protein DSO02_05395 [Hadesarchaea archaeon]
MKNPFLYGKVVSGEHFIDRERELAELEAHVEAGRSVILYSSRGMGKTSLVEEFFRRTEGKYTSILIDLFGIQSREALARELVGKVAKKVYGTFERMRKGLQDFLRGLRVDMVLTPGGEVRFELLRTPTEEDLAQVLDLPEKVAEEKGLRMVIAFDEFQEIRNLDGEAMEKLMRSRFQHHRRVTYLFTGSRRHLLDEIFSEERRAFYRFGEPMELGPIPGEEFAKYIEEGFRRTGGRISGAAIAHILDLTGGHPSFTQQLCYELWFLSKRVDDEAAVEKAVENVILHERIHYFGIWENLTPLQRRLLEGLAKEEVGPYSQEFISKYGLRSPAHVRKGLELLEKRGLVERGKILDVFFREWIRRGLP